MALTDNNQVTRFYSRFNDGDGPVSGAIQMFPVTFSNIATNTVAHARIDVPAGMSFYISNIQVRSGTVVSDPSLTIGAVSGGQQIVAATNLSKDMGSLTLLTNVVPAGGLIDVRITTDAGDSAEDVCVLIVGYVTSPPNELKYRQ